MKIPLGIRPSAAARLSIESAIVVSHPVREKESPLLLYGAPGDSTILRLPAGVRKSGRRRGTCQSQDAQVPRPRENRTSGRRRKRPRTASAVEDASFPREDGPRSGVAAPDIIASGSSSDLQIRATAAAAE
jgi:hypothetical protein